MKVAPANAPFHQGERTGARLPEAAQQQDCAGSGFAELLSSLAAGHRAGSRAAAAEHAAAEMFNEHGFFPAPPPTVTVSPEGSADHPPPIAASEARPAAAADAQPSAAGSFPAAAELRPGLSAGIASAGGAVSAKGGPVPGAPNVATSSRIGEAASGSAGRSAALPAQILQSAARQAKAAAKAPAPLEGKTSAVQLGLSASGETLDLNVRLERLSREERLRLRAEIAQLLARHGFAPGEIRLNGEAREVD